MLHRAEYFSGWNPTTRWLSGLVPVAVLWAFVYSRLYAFADGVVGLLGLSRDTHLGEALHFFLYDIHRP